MTLTLRKGRIEDLENLFPLVDGFATSFKVERSAFEESLRHLLSDDAAHLTGAESDGELIGYCLGADHCAFYANGRVAWVEEITVKEEVRRMGVGRELIEEFEAWCITRGSKLVALATRRAGPFYEAIGYEESAVYYRKVLEGQSESET